MEIGEMRTDTQQTDREQRAERLMTMRTKSIEHERTALHNGYDKQDVTSEMECITHTTTSNYVQYIKAYTLFYLTYLNDLPYLPYLTYLNYLTCLNYLT